ncbi:MAG TPA: hypothetical protein VFU88_17725 [Ktedonobacterales bacterium]|nr:hypothetical protein [Ktedonobacterales bacterium]
MRSRILGGLVSWLVAVLPLVAVNLAGLAALFDFGEMILAGAVALVGGLLCGGVLAGYLGGRPRPGHPGGAAAGAATGATAALVYLPTVLVLVLAASAADSASLLVQQTSPQDSGAQTTDVQGTIGMLMALLFVCVLLVGIAALTGAIVGRRGSVPPAKAAARRGAASLPARGASSPIRPPARPPAPSVPAAGGRLIRSPLPDAEPSPPHQPLPSRPDSAYPYGDGRSPAQGSRARGGEHSSRGRYE